MINLQAVQPLLIVIGEAAASPEQEDQEACALHFLATIDMFIIIPSF